MQFRYRMAHWALLAASLLAGLQAGATTWDEPWQEAVVKDADTFVKARVLKNDKTSMTLKVLKHLDGVETPETLTVDGFSLLRLTSLSVGHGPQFNLAINEDW